MKHVAELVMVILVLLVVAGIGYGSWVFKRKINYKYSYGNLVKVQIDKTMEEHINKYHKGEVNED